MRDNVKEIARLLGELVCVPEPVVEVGSLQVEGQVDYADVRPFFRVKEYIGCDMRQGPGVDRIENVHQLTFPDDSIGTMLMLDTLEHVADCHRAMAEAFRTLRPGGLTLIVSVMDFAVHLHPSDYWRFTPQAFDLLLDQFSPRWVFLQGNPFCPHTVIGVGVKNADSASLPDGLERFLEHLREVSTDLASVNYDDPNLAQEYPFHDAHSGYAALEQMFEEAAALREQIETERSVLAQCREALQRQTEELSALQNSVGWRLVSQARRLRQRLFPFASRRGALYDAVWRKLR